MWVAIIYPPTALAAPFAAFRTLRCPANGTLFNIARSILRLSAPPRRIPLFHAAFPIFIALTITLTIKPIITAGFQISLHCIFCIASVVKV